MIDSINQEISLCVIMTNEPVETIYFGGGTPSLLSVDEVQSMLDALHKKFNITPGAEITLEANPDNITIPLLLEWKKMGINRLSVGIQSFMDEELKWMNRAHTAAESVQCIDDIFSAGFTNFSVDLIFGSPLSGEGPLKENLETIFNKKIPHISCYALTVEPKTLLENLIRNKRSLPVNSDSQSAQFLLIMEWMRNSGYEHYEISNFSKPGMRSRHNSSYWKGISYYGFGPSAHSFNGTNIRRWNVANNAAYIQSLNQGIIPYSEEILTPTQQLNEYIMISLRTTEGMSVDRIGVAFGEKYKQKILSQSLKYITAGQIVWNDSMLQLSDAGKLLADGLAADLFFSENS